MPRTAPSTTRKTTTPAASASQNRPDVFSWRGSGGGSPDGRRRRDARAGAAPRDAVGPAAATVSGEVTTAASRGTACRDATGQGRQRHSIRATRVGAPRGGTMPPAQPPTSSSPAPRPPAGRSRPAQRRRPGAARTRTVGGRLRLLAGLVVLLSVAALRRLPGAAGPAAAGAARPGPDPGRVLRLRREPAARRAVRAAAAPGRLHRGRARGARLPGDGPAGAGAGAGRRGRSTTPAACSTTSAAARGHPRHPGAGARGRGAAAGGARADRAAAGAGRGRERLRRPPVRSPRTTG